MANFDIAFKKIMRAEGTYSNHPDDRGGETYKGIARNFHKEWKGWKTIDIYKKKFPDRFASKLDKVDELQDAVKTFYKVNFWNILELDKCGSQKIANELFDDSVNCGIVSALKKFQRAAGIPVNGTLSTGVRELLKELK